MGNRKNNTVNSYGCKYFIPDLRAQISLQCRSGIKGRLINTSKFNYLAAIQPRFERLNRAGLPSNVPLYYSKSLLGEALFADQSN